MIFCVVPRPLANELYPRLLDYYKNEDNVTVIVDRREFDRRARYGQTHKAQSAEKQQRRIVRDRRRARVAGDLPPLAHVG